MDPTSRPQALKETMALTLWAPLLGGVLIGVSAGALYLFAGRIAGISSILGEGLRLDVGVAGWRWAFLAGLLAGGAVLLWMGGEALPETLTQPLPLLGVAGLLVGYGSRLGGGCTSGHGVCGLAHRSGRALVGTLTFMGVAVVTVFLTHHLLGGLIP